MMLIKFHTTKWENSLQGRVAELKSSCVVDPGEIQARFFISGTSPEPLSALSVGICSSIEIFLIGEKEDCVMIAEGVSQGILSSICK